MTCSLGWTGLWHSLATRRARLWRAYTATGFHIRLRLTFLIVLFIAFFYAVIFLIIFLLRYRLSFGSTIIQHKSGRL
jgi:hypothetical protein